ncbi:MAG: sulfurtransferase [Acidimicrobiales bacterium]|nr:sulfurtransferase [Acidimicrobiales bacterium]
MATNGGPVISAAWLAEHFADVVVVDCRWSLDDGPRREAYEEAHLPTAVFANLDVDLSAPPSAVEGRHPLPAPEAFAAAMGRLGIGDDTRVVAYDDAGGVVAARLWWMLDALGRSAAVLDGGLAAWDGPIESGPVNAEPATFTPVPWPADRVISKSDLAASLDVGLVVLDARAPDRFAHGGLVDPRPGHVPTARNAPVGFNLADGHFRRADDLADHYASVGATAEADVVVYCGSGVSACADLIGLRLAGLPDARLFVGSWSAWGADHNLPNEVGA